MGEIMGISNSVKFLPPLVLIVLGCQHSSTCGYPSGADTSSDAGDAGIMGCSPGPAMNSCEQSAPGSMSCRSICGESEYTLTCRSGAITTLSPIPEPAGSLNCRVIPGPTPSNMLFYCCPCTQ